MRGKRELGAIGLALIAITGCGTTVPLASRGQETSVTSGHLTDATTTSTSSGQSRQHGSAAAAMAGASTQAGPRQFPGMAGPSGSAGEPGPELPNVGATGHGFTATTITLGFEYLTAGSGPGTEAFVGKALSIGDPKQQYQALVDDLNRHGGLAGRKIIPVFHGTQYSDLFTNPDGAAAAGCADLTEDHHVFAVVVYTSLASLVECIAKQGVPVISLAIYPLSGDVFERFPSLLYAPAEVNLARMGDVLVQRLAGTSWLRRGVTTGVLYGANDPAFKRAADRLVANLTAAGYAPKEVVAVTGESVSSAVLSFRAANVDRVMFVESGGGLVYQFATTAESQRYRPQYALSSNDNLGTQAQLMPAEQLKNVTGVSWNAYDVGASHDLPTPPARTRCFQLYRAAQVDLSDRNTQYSAVAICDAVTFAAQVLKGLVTPSVVGLRNAVDGLADSYSSAIAFRTFLSPRRHDGAALTRIAIFDPSCSCFGYTRAAPVATP